MPDLDAALDAIDAALEGDDLEAALRLAKRATRDFPEEADAYLQYGDVLIEADEFEAAREAYEQATQLASDDATTWASLGWGEFLCLNFEAARRAATRANTLDSNPDAWVVLGRLEERDGRLDEAERCFRRAAALMPDEYSMPVRISEADFRAAVAEALDRLPDDFRSVLDGQVAVLVEPVPPVELLRREEPALDPELLGLYTGTPLPERTTDGTAYLPDIVYLFQHNLEHVAGDREELIEQIAITVYHEIGHYLGYDDDDLDERGLG